MALHFRAHASRRCRSSVFRLSPSPPPLAFARGNGVGPRLPSSSRPSSYSIHAGGGGYDDDDESRRRRRGHRLRRSVHFVPADNDRFLVKSLSLGADSVVYDLEDSVRDKSFGREILRSFLEEKISPGTSSSHSHRPEVLVRINPVSGPHWREDVLAGFDGADGFVVPKVESREELVMLDEMLDDMERREASSSGGSRRYRQRVLLPIATETPIAVLNIADIARGPRVCAITWGCEDLSAELGSLGTRDESDGGYLDVFRHCRTMCLLAARAANVQAIDGIYQDVRDGEGFIREATMAMRMGYDGKLTVHPDQIRGVHRAFVPTTAEMNEAERIVSMWEEGGGGAGGDDDGDGGRGSMECDGKMIDLPHYVRAKKVVARGDAGRDDRFERRRDDVDDAPDEGGTTPAAAGGGETSGLLEDDITLFPRVYLGKYLEDLHPGLKIRHFLTRTVTESDNVFFTCLTLNPAPIHLDHELSRENADALCDSASAAPGAGKPLFNSMFTLALLVGMSVPESTHGTTVANLGFSEVSFPRPVYPGDTLRAETEVLDRRESRSRPTQGIVTFRHVAYNQRGEVVCTATRQALMKRRP